MAVKRKPVEDSTQPRDVLHSSAVDELVEAQTGRTKAYPKEELRKYRSRKGITIADWLKILLIKAWFAGVVCYFMIWGLGVYLSATLDLLFVAGIAMGFVVNLLLNNLLRFMEETPGSNSRWMMFPAKHIMMLPLDLVYAFVLILCVYNIYTGVNGAYAAYTGDPNAVLVGVQPVLFGVLYVGCDSLFIGIKRLLKKILRDARRKVDGSHI